MLLETALFNHKGFHPFPQVALMDRTPTAQGSVGVSLMNPNALFRLWIFIRGRLRPRSVNDGAS
jgi:hypothetical protein